MSRSEQKSRQRSERKLTVMLLVLSWVATFCFSGLYVRRLKIEKQSEVTGSSGGILKWDELRADYEVALARTNQAEQTEKRRKSVNDLMLSFIDAYYILPDSREELLTGCQKYVSEDAWSTVKLLSENCDYGEQDRILLYYQEDCTESEEDDSHYDAFAIFTVRKITDSQTNDQSYMLVTTVETDGDTVKITDIQTMTAIYFHAD